MVKTQNKIGIVGITGDLGSQLATKLQNAGFEVLGFSLSLKNNITINDLVNSCEIIHICAPLVALKGIKSTGQSLIVLHDSVMNTSLQAQNQLLQGKGAIVHMLMNQSGTVIIAQESTELPKITKHFKQLGMPMHLMTVAEHDKIMARSQAPLAILCQTLLPYLFEKQDKGLLTPSGELLVQTLRSRQLAWTDETIHSILRNPEIESLINDMQHTIKMASKPHGASVEKKRKKYGSYPS